MIWLPAIGQKSRSWTRSSKDNAEKNTSSTWFSWRQLRWTSLPRAEETKSTRGKRWSEVNQPSASSRWWNRNAERSFSPEVHFRPCLISLKTTHRLKMLASFTWTQTSIWFLSQGHFSGWKPKTLFWKVRGRPLQIRCRFISTKKCTKANDQILLSVRTASHRFSGTGIRFNRCKKSGKSLWRQTIDLGESFHRWVSWEAVETARCSSQLTELSMLEMKMGLTFW